MNVTDIRCIIRENRPAKLRITPNVYHLADGLRAGVGLITPALL